MTARPPDVMAAGSRRGPAAVPVGRAAVLAAGDDLLAGLAQGPRVLVLEGEAGIGKTTVWQALVDRGAARGVRVLSCRAVEAEGKMAFVSLADLLEPVIDGLLADLPAPQRSALEVALLRAAPPEGGDGRAVGAGALSVLARLAAAGPLLVALDDVQWLDRASAAALVFALRRLRDRPLGIAVTRRSGIEGAGDPLGLRQAFGDRVEQVRLGPLPLDALHELIGQRLPRTLPRPTLQRVVQASGGNPLLALELAGALLESGLRPGLADPLPVPATVAALVAERVGALPSAAQEGLLAAACLAVPTVARIEEALGPHAAAALEDAAAAGLVVLDPAGVRFPHPLYASAVAAVARPSTRRGLHRRLAQIVDDPEERARHIALAARGPDAAAAALLDAAADRARARGAPGEAGDLGLQALRLTPTGGAEAAQRRRIAAAEHLFRAGDLQQARALLEEVADAVDGRRRAHVLRLLGELRFTEDSFAEAIPLLRRALALAQDPEAAAEILLDLAFAHFSTDDVGQALAAAREAVRRAEPLGPGPVLAEALAVEANVAFFAGEDLDADAVARALRMEDPDRAVQLLVRPSTIATLFCIYAGRLAEGADRLRSLRARALERGEDSDCLLLTWLSWAELWRGNLAAAERCAEEAGSLAGQSGSATLGGGALAHRAMARAQRGDEAGARDDLARCHALLADVGWAVVQAWSEWTLGFLELSLGDPEAAVAAFAPSVAAVEGRGVPEPFAAGFLPDAIEALLAVGEVERAEWLLDAFEGRARELGRTVALVGATRCRALLLAARGDIPGALAAIGESLAAAARTEVPLEQARSLLLDGQLQRRARRKQAALASLSRAERVFDELGAALWAARARGELRRVGSRAAPGQLTATEERVAELAATGRTNREIAGALFISPKTVEANLASVYRKLAIRSRAELGWTMADRGRA